MEGHHSVNVTPFCLPEVQACISGKICLVGLRPAVLHGSTAAAKFDSINKLTWSELEALATRAGFSCALLKGEICAIPAGMIVATLIPENDVCHSRPVQCDGVGRLRGNAQRARRYVAVFCIPGENRLCHGQIFVGGFCETQGMISLFLWGRRDTAVISLALWGGQGPAWHPPQAAF